MNPSWREKREHGVESPQDHYQAGASGVPREENGRHPKERPRASQFAHPSLGITEPLTQSGTVRNKLVGLPASPSGSRRGSQEEPGSHPGEWWTQHHLQRRMQLQQQNPPLLGRPVLL